MALELVKIAQNQLVISVGFLVVLSDVVQALDTVLVFSLQLGQVVLEVVELAFELGTVLLPGLLLLLLALLHVIEFLLQVLVRVALVAQSVLEALGLLVHLVELVVVFLLHLVSLVAQGLEFVAELAGARHQVHVLVVQLFVLGPLLVDRLAVFVRHFVELGREVLVFVVELRVARVGVRQVSLELFDFGVQRVDALVFVVLLALETALGLLEFLLLVAKAQLQLLLLEVDVVQLLLGLLQFVGQAFVLLVDVLERAGLLLDVELEFVVVLLERILGGRAGLGLLGQLEVVQVDLVLQILDFALLLLYVLAHGRQAYLILALYFLSFVVILVL